MAQKPLDVITISTTLPRRCGIATFNDDVTRELGALGLSVKNIALERPGVRHAYPTTTITTISQENRRAYADAARLINALKPGVVLLEHEFGIFGGQDGEHIIELLTRLAIPVVTIAHTYPFTQATERARHQAVLLRQVSALSAAVITMSSRSRGRLAKELASAGIATPILHIPHGTPDIEDYYLLSQRRRRQPGDSITLATFGLISERKGIDDVVAILPAILARHDNLRFRIIGAPHPADRAAQRYMHSLRAQVAQQHMERHVVFTTRFLSVQEVMESLRATDIYVTFYKDPDQASSGTLAYALAAGCCVVATPYVHAKELLGGERGVLVPFNDRAALQAAIIDLLDNPARRLAHQQRALAFGRTTAWPLIGRQYLQVLQRTSRRPLAVTQEVAVAFSAAPSSRSK